MNTAFEQNGKRLRVNGKEYAILKLLGKGKGGYSYLAHDGFVVILSRMVYIAGARDFTLLVS